MDIIESVKMAGTTLLANKMRSTLTMLGIIIGNASVIAMIGIGEGAQKFVGDQVNSLGTNVLFIVPGSPEAQSRPVYPPQTLVLEDAEAIAEQVPTVQAVAPMLNASELMTFRSRNVSASIVGTNPDILTVRNLDVARGRFISELDLRRNEQVVALGSELAEQLFGNQNPVGQSVRMKNVSLQVIGVMQPKGSTFGDNMDMNAYVPLTTMANRITGRTSPYGMQVTFISVSVRDEQSMGAAQFQIENLLRLRHKITDEDDFTVRNQKDLMNILGSITGALTLMLAAVAGISLFVGGIGIMNIMLVSVTERTKEIGLRKAIGASEQDILIQFVIEAIILSAVGGAIGTGLGIGGVLLVGAFSPLNAGVSAGAIAVAVGVSGGIGLFFGVFPARQAAKLDPIVALRSA
ncbi:ABC transporter permease [Desertifilum sp. FACHB-1129]|uniref:ABC transporter permease n=1 Tax=Desertifilum tharense IPPAS B-1220 TaxID=1781255 RepID=A0A1E5QDP2_9CYAN|nr:MULTISPECIES: ABC transporter permease [Desertifilum]MDA0212015.1 ABC transporter permease [Cyanobacteria bacterium FC1]MBD2315091.1 ABC transporter permease [Desertifilum sp. FACHB-1129]MBD2324927.1 ABC transporter permease [Desertifilum sp. FACHB-866]MBD2335020.1 ABC transporter permease [Desertifilum sp. FACHB-868]OEJ72747.1 ABC transporter permease [Desertifilum tharense IPPAS B-1220]